LAPPAPAATLHPLAQSPQPADTPTQTHPAPRKEKHSHKSSSGRASHGSSAKESPCTVRCKAQTSTRDTCTSPSPHRTTQPKAGSLDADKDLASQTASYPSSSPTTAEPPAAAPSPSCPLATPQHAAPGTNPQRSAPSAAPQPAPDHSTQTPSLKQHAYHHSLATQASTRHLWACRPRPLRVERSLRDWCIPSVSSSRWSR